MPRRSTHQVEASCRDACSAFFGCHDEGEVRRAQGRSHQASHRPRAFPHQVAIRIPEGGLVTRLMTMHKFCTTYAKPYKRFVPGIFLFSTRKNDAIRSLPTGGVSSQSYSMAARSSCTRAGGTHRPLFRDPKSYSQLVVGRRVDAAARQHNRRRITTQYHERDQPPDCPFAVGVSTDELGDVADRRRLRFDPAALRGRGKLFMRWGND